MNHVTKKTFGGLRPGRLKSLKFACSATVAIKTPGILDITTLGIIVSKQRTAKALIGLRRLLCLCCSHMEYYDY